MGAPAQYSRGMTFREGAIRATAWTAIQNWGSQGIGFATFVILARLLPPESFGQVAYVAVFFGFSLILVNGGFPQAIVQREDLAPEHLDTAFWSNAGIALALMSAVLLGADTLAGWIGDPEMAPLMRWLSPSLVLGALSGTQQAVLRRRLQMRPLALRAMVASALGGLVGVGMAVGGYGVWSLVGQNLAGAGIGVVVLWTSSEWRPHLRFSRSHFMDLFRFGRSLVGTAALFFVSNRSDRFLIGGLLGSTALGLYVVGDRALGFVLRTIEGTINTVGLPVFSRIQQEPERARSAYYQALRVNSIVTFPIYLALIALAPEMIVALVGDRWLPAAPVVRVLSVLGITQTMQLLAVPIINAMGKPAWGMGIAAASALLVLGGVLLAIPYGITAVAGAVALRGLLVLPLLLYCVRRLIGIEIGALFGLYWAPMSAALILGGVAVGLDRAMVTSVPLHIRLVLTSLGAGIAYLGALRILAPETFQEAGDLMLSALPRSLRDRIPGLGGGGQRR